MNRIFIYVYTAELKMADDVHDLTLMIIIIIIIIIITKIYIAHMQHGKINR